MAPEDTRIPDAAVGPAQTPARMPHAPDHVTVLLALFDGARTITDQLLSLIAQSHPSWSLIVSDDGSSDEGPDLVRAFFAEHPAIDLTLIDGPGMGFAQNFLHLLRSADTRSPYVSFCDQDDVWLPFKTARAVEALAQGDPAIPALYCGRTLHCDAELRPLGESPMFFRPPDFRNALLQNIGGGNTIVLNNAALRLLQAASRRVEVVVSHDWWMYQMISGCGGQVLYESRPGLLYRQHGSNAVGANGSVKTAAGRFLSVLRGRYRDWNDLNIAALDANRTMLTPANQRILDGFRDSRTMALPRRLHRLAGLGLYRQSHRDNAAFWLAAALGRV